MRSLAVLAATCMTLTGSTALADTPRARNRGSEACTQASSPKVDVRFHRHRVVRLQVSNPCEDKVVFISWFLEDEASESDFDGLVVYPGVQVDWNAKDLDRVSAASGLGLSGDLYASGIDAIDYCWDTDGTIYKITTAGIGHGDACPRTEP